MTIEVLVGMIASGKSTYARARADQGALVVSHDALTEMLHARYRYEQGLRTMYRDMEEALAWLGILAGRDVVIDRTHLTRESRSRWITFVRQPFRWPGDLPRIIAITFPMESAGTHAERRYLLDRRGRSFEEWHKVAQHHAGLAGDEPLDESEGFDEIRPAHLPLQED